MERHAAVVVAVVGRALHAERYPCVDVDHLVVHGFLPIRFDRLTVERSDAVLIVLVVDWFDGDVDGEVLVVEIAVVHGEIQWAIFVVGDLAEQTVTGAHGGQAQAFHHAGHERRGL